MKKVLFLGRFPPPVHGAALMNENYFQNLEKFKDIDIKRIKINYSDSLEEIGKINLKKFFGFFIVFFKLLNKLVFFRPQVIYFELAPSGFAFYRDSIYVLLCKLFRKRIVFHLHAKGVSSGAKLISRKYKKFIFKNTKVIILSNLLYYDIKDFVKKKDVFIVPNAIKDNLTDKQFKKIIEKRRKNKEINLLFLSNMIEEKGPIDVLLICKILKNHNINFRCDFVGVFSDESFKNKFFNKIKELELEKNCFYLGPKYGEEKFKILEKTDFLIFPTAYDKEVFPLVVLEAFMYGIPVFSYDNGAIKEIISKDYLGFVAKKGDFESLAKTLLKRIKEKKDFSDKIREEFKNKYILGISIKKLKNILVN